MKNSGVICSVMRFVTLAGVLILTGCTPVPPRWAPVMPPSPLAYDSDPEEFESVPDSHGVVIFQVANVDSLRGGGPPWNVAHVSRIGGGPITWVDEDEVIPQKYIVRAEYETLPGTMLFVGILPEGNYLAENLYAMLNYVGSYIAAPVPDRYAAFKIAPGEVTVLDTYLYKSFDRNYLLTNNESPHDLLHEASEAFSDVLASLNEWAVHFPMRSVTRSGDVVRQLTKWVNTTGFAESAPDGRLYLPARLGHILERDPKGNWVLTSIGTTEHVRSIKASTDGEVVVVTVGGNIFQRKAGESEFVEIPFDQEGYLRNIRLTDSGEWVALAILESEEVRHQGTYSEEITVYHAEVLATSDLASGKWKSIATVPTKGHGVQLHVSGERAFILSDGEETRFVDLATGETLRTRKRFRLMQAHGEGRILALSGSGTLGSRRLYAQYSADNGSTWKELDDVRLDSLPTLSGDGRLIVAGLRTKRTRQEQMAGQSPYEGIITKLPSARNWDPLLEMPEGCSGLKELRRMHDGLLVLCEYNAFFRPDDRNEWKREDMRGFEGEE